MLDLFPKTLWKHKIRTRQNRLGKPLTNIESSLSSVDDYLLESNNLALEYFKENKNPLRRLWEYWHLDPHCGSHSTYTYAAFLSLTKEHERLELQEQVRWVGGIYACEKISGHHAWIEKRTWNEWKAFETIPEMRDLPALYVPWYTFQITENSSKVTSEKFLGLLALWTYGFTN
jgi:hypothetical protein